MLNMQAIHVFAGQKTNLINVCWKLRGSWAKKSIKFS